MAYQCALCHPTVYIAADLGNMKSHLGHRTLPGHNMGPFRCQARGCTRRAQRGYVIGSADLEC